MPDEARAIAFYLPQYHPIPENDEWWGKGFTEWTNTAKAKPLFKDHYQPHVPADLGFYDLRLEESRCAQAELAQSSGIEGFCYYHYWFGNGKELLERPFNEVLRTGKPDFPFCLAWANQSWAGVWHGLDKKVLIEQTYPGEDDHRRHFQSLLIAFTDKRYIKVSGKPVFVIYRPSELPGGQNTLDFWRDLSVKAGLPGLYLIAEHDDLSGLAMPVGYDAYICQRNFPRRRDWISWSEPLRKIRGILLDFSKRPTIIDYQVYIDHLIPDRFQSDLAIPCVLPNWDNTPRSGYRGLVMLGSTPELFAKQVEKALRHSRKKNINERFLFIKSWNEWAEGNYLEPDLKYGHKYLDALRVALLSK